MEEKIYIHREGEREGKIGRNRLRWRAREGIRIGDRHIGRDRLR